MTPKTLRKERAEKFTEIVGSSNLHYLARRFWEIEGVDTQTIDAMLKDEREKLAYALADAAASRSESVEAQADRKVDAILALEKQTQAKEAAGEAWRGRELLMPDLLPYGDWWHKKTGLHMYARKGKPNTNKDWLKAFREWADNELTIPSLEAAFENNKWRGVISTPLILTKDAIAIQAAPVVETTQPTAKVYKAEEEPQKEYVPAPERKR
jgi:hypothetical protein